MSDDTQRLIRETLPRLAYQIVDSGPRRMSSKRHFGNRPNRTADDQSDWGRADREKALQYVKTATINGSNAYLYATGPRAPWYIAFYGIRLTKIEKVEPMPVDMNPGDVRLVSVDKQENDGPGIGKMRISDSIRKEKGSEFSFAQALENEFTASMTRSAKAGIDGIAEASVELKTEFRTMLKLEAGQLLTASESMERVVEEEYQMYPYSTLEILVEKGEPDVTVTARTWGTLECNVRIDIRDCNCQDFPNLGNLMAVWAGGQPGSEFYSNYFSAGNSYLRQDALDEWNVPKLMLDLTATGKRVEYKSVKKRHRPIPGRERDFEIGRRAHYRSIGD